jgi:hypothetical protein
MSERVVNSIVELADSAANGKPDVEKKVEEFKKAVTEEPILGPEVILDPEKVGKVARAVVKGAKIAKDVYDLVTEARKP